MAPFDNFDKRLTGLIRSLPPQTRPYMDGLSLVGEPLVVLSVASAGFIAALAHGQQAEQTAFILGAIAFGLSSLLKLALKRARPQGLIIRNFGINSYSFPSGHAFGTMIFFGLFAVTDARDLALPWSAVISAMIASLVFSIGVSRVYKGAHFPSDVLAGWLLGGISLVVIYRLAF